MEDRLTEKTPSFPNTFDQFIIFVDKVLQYNASGELLIKSSNQANAIQAAFNKYKKLFNEKRNSSTHVDKFKEVYFKSRPQIKKCITNDVVDLDEFMKWFEDTKYVILPRPESKCKILLSGIFRSCCRIARHIQDQAEKNVDLYDDPAAVYPDSFMLHLFRLFYHCADESDKKKIIQPIIDDLESTLGLKKNEAPAISDGMGELFSDLRDLAESVGIPVPEGTPSITGGQIKEAIGVFKNDATVKDTFKDAFQGLDYSNPKNIPGMIGKIFEKMQQNATTPPEAVQRSLAATADNYK